MSKYSAVLSAGGLAAFVLLSANQRHWLKHPAPYVSAIVALAMITPVILWNARHGWASFEFQGARGVPGDELRPAQVFTMALGEIAFLSPWIFAALISALVFAFRHSRDDRCMFLLCLSLPPIVLFTVTPLWGGRGFAHWAMPGWFFTYALMGGWVNESGFSVGALRRWALLSSALLAAIAGVAVLQTSTGWPLLTLLARSSLPDPTLDAFEWRKLSEAPIFEQAPSFVVSTKWSDAGKIALALGPQVPVFVLSNDPRGWAFLDESEKFIGRNGMIVVRAAELDSALVAVKSLFRRARPTSVCRARATGPRRNPACANPCSWLNAWGSLALSERGRLVVFALAEHLVWRRMASDAPLARSNPTLSVIVPTYQESANIPVLFER